MGLRSFVALPVGRGGTVIRLKFEHAQDADTDSLTTSADYGSTFNLYKNHNFYLNVFSVPSRHYGYDIKRTTEKVMKQLFHVEQIIKRIQISRDIIDLFVKPFHIIIYCTK
jgi:hypothetical protein